MYWLDLCLIFITQISPENLVHLIILLFDCYEIPWFVYRFCREGLNFFTLFQLFFSCCGGNEIRLCEVPRTPSFSLNTVSNRFTLHLLLKPLYLSLHLLPQKPLLKPCLPNTHYVEGFAVISNEMQFFLQELCENQRI